MSKEKVAIITAAGKGMGAAIARRLADDGYKLGLLSPSGGAEKLAKELGGVGITGSVTSTGDLERLVKETEARFGAINAVVNNTGHPPKGPLLDISDTDWMKGLDMILLPVIRTARLVTPIMQGNGGGAIVNISTYAALEPDPAFPVSCALRAALASFTKLYSDQYGKAGIRMNNLLPGFIDSLPESAERRAKVPLGRYGTTKEIAATVAFLLSEGAGYITGQNIRADGGITRHV